VTIQPEFTPEILKELYYQRYNHLAPLVQRRMDLYPYNLALAGPGELSLLLWLLAVGVNVERWKEQASSAIVKA